ncbi:MAG: ATP-binding protein [Clostridiales bacterium]|nr:ATP-binding protein [Clostridiales bacterium]
MKWSKEQDTDNIDLKCKRCRGIGYIIVDEEVADYGYHQYAKVCPVCKAGNPDDQRIKAGLPQKFFTTCFPDFKFDLYQGGTENIKKIVESFFMDFGKWKDRALGLYLWSNVRGTGKTMLACALSNSLMIKNGVSVRFTTVPDYLERLKQSFNQKPEETDHARQYRECDLLVLDDLGAEKNGTWQNQELFRLIDYRYTRQLPVIVTSNSPVNQLECDVRVIDRLYDMTVMLHLPEDGIRMKKADERKRMFLASVLSK